MYDRILVPTDGSEATDAAITRAIDLARQYDATLDALYVVDPAAMASGIGIGELVESLSDYGQRAVAEVRARASEAGVETAAAEVQHGTPFQVILDYTDLNGIDLIVMGTHGRRGLDRYVLGSTTERVVRLSDVPVLTVRAPVE